MRESARERKAMNNGLSGVYGMASIGAAVYYVQHATSFWSVVAGLVRAVFWPAVLMYHALSYLKM
jgi:hypothetical protein